MVEPTHLKNISRIGSFPQGAGWKCPKCLSCHHLVDSKQRGGCHFPAIWTQMPHVKLGSIFPKFRGENMCSATWPIRTTGTKNISHRIHLVPQTTSIFYGCFNWMLWLFRVPGIYKYICPDLVDVYGKCIRKYTSPMDPSWVFQQGYPPWNSQRVYLRKLVAKGDLLRFAFLFGQNVYYDLPGTLNNFLMDVWWNNHFICI